MQILSCLYPLLSPIFCCEYCCAYYLSTITEWLTLSSFILLSSSLFDLFEDFIAPAIFNFFCFNSISYPSLWCLYLLNSSKTAFLLTRGTHRLVFCLIYLHLITMYQNECKTDLVLFVVSVRDHKNLKCNVHE